MLAVASEAPAGASKRINAEDKKLCEMYGFVCATSPRRIDVMPSTKFTPDTTATVPPPVTAMFG